jgi:predicted ATPase
MPENPLTDLNPGLIVSDRPEWRAPLQLGSFELWPAARRLRQHGKCVAVTARAFDVLALLAARQPDLVSKSVLMAVVWPGLIVEENNLQVQISALRKILGHDAITTVPGFGYRLNLPVADGAPAADHDTWRSSTAATLHGRAGDLAELDELMQQHRLVSLLGAAGVGKSALARHVVPTAGTLTIRADLADCAGMREVLQAMAASLDVEELAGPGALARHLGRRACLLVLDNADRVATLLAPLITELLAHTATCVLVTTQVRLHLAQEQVYRLRPLDIPPAGSTLAEALQYGALALLAARARGHDHRFTLTGTLLSDAIELCRQLDGLPLALELAASRIPALGVAGLLERMSDCLTVLTTAHPTAPARQHSLLDALAWSYGLLGPAEQALWCATARMPAYFSLEDLMADGTGRDIGCTLDLLGTLVERSLLTFYADPVPCYTLAASHRQFALRQGGAGAMPG